MYPVYRRLSPPSCIDHSVSCRFTSPTDINLIVARGSLLQIYKFLEEPKLVAEETDDMDQVLLILN